MDGNSIHRSHAQTIAWLLESDPEQPGVRYFTLRDLLEAPEEDRTLQKAQADVMASGPVHSILATQEPEGYWVKPGPGYVPKYTGTIWQLIFLAQLGADRADTRVQAACEYVLSNSMASNGVFSGTGSPSGFIHCLAGNLISACIDLERMGDDRVRNAINRQARLITGENIPNSSNSKTDLRYYRSGTSGPAFACAHNANHSCAWAAVKTLLALSKVPTSMRCETVKQVIHQSASLLLSRDPAMADYPSIFGKRPSVSWFKFGYPLGYIADVLQNVEALAGAGYIHDRRLDGALAMIESKQDNQGRWFQEYVYRGSLCFNPEKTGQPSKWISLRALRILKAASTA